MAYIESSYKQLLFGVSQQDYKDRLDGQNEEQVNMVSDLTFNLRRRAPLRFAQWSGVTTPGDRLAHFDTTVSNARLSLLVDTTIGQVRVVATTGVLQITMSAGYLLANSGSSIKFATVGDSVFIVNTERRPTVQPAPEAAALPPAPRRGYYYVLAGQFSKEYRLTVLNRSTGVSTSVSYTTPDGSTAGDAALTTPEYIAQQLQTAAAANGAIGTAAGVTYAREGPYVYISSANFDITVSSDSGSMFILTSLAGNIRTVGDLPARLPDTADGFIVGVGTSKTSTYYRWDAERQSWLEDASWDAYQTLTDMPVRLFLGPTTWQLEIPVYERRASGDAETNPNPHFTETDITGISTFQGRLVILANDTVSMSASDNPLRWYRSTVASLESDDPIEIASTASQSAPYRWAVPFNLDLVLWADRYQSVVPGTVAVTPANASIAVLSQYEAQLQASPVLTGRSVFFAAPRSFGFSGIWEAVPSDFSDTQLIGTDVTNHIPRYVHGDIRFMAASSTSSILVAGFAGALNELLVHEYLWQGNEKQHHSWHKWVFDWDIEHAWFVVDRLHMYVRVAGELAYAILDLRIGAGDSSPSTGRLDLFQDVTVTGAGQIVLETRLVDVWLQDGGVWAFKMSGSNPFMPQLLTELDRSGGLSTMLVQNSAPGDTFRVGRRFTSRIVPTAPSARDRNEVPITTARTLIHKWVVSLNNTGEFTYTVSDKYRPPIATKTSPLKFGSPELSAGQPLVAGGQQYIPARLDMPTSRLELSTDDVYDMNITSLEYGFRYHQRYGKRR